MSMLHKIVERTRADLVDIKAARPAQQLLDKINQRGDVANPFLPCLRANAPMALLAEVKRASPSKGDIAKGADAPATALAYALAGACTISVLTEPHWFKGSLNDLEQVRASLVASGRSPGVCVLRKDFIVDEYQLLEARAHGADTALLIVAVLPADELVHLISFSRNLGMEPLVEVATEDEMATALAAGSKVIGINNRNLHTFEVDMGRTGRLAAMVPAGSDVFTIALSGVTCRSDVEAFAGVGAGAVLVGEALMRAPSPEALISELLARPRQPPLCKICGLRDAEAAGVAAAAGADLIGMIFAKSKRQVDVQAAQAMVAAVRRERPRPADWAMPPYLATNADHQLTPRAWLLRWRALLTDAASKGGPLTVGVFVNSTVEEMNRIAEDVPLDLIQLHGDEGWSIAKQLVRPAIRVVHMEPGVSAADVVGSIEGGSAVAVLLDSKGGGTGKTFDWKVGAEVQQLAPFILAGGLNPENVGSAVAAVTPWAFDVSSGVETDGVKDHEKIVAFVRAGKA